jgi:hypothetical protein
MVGKWDTGTQPVNEHSGPAAGKAMKTRVHLASSEQVPDVDGVQPPIGQSGAEGGETPPVRGLQELSATVSEFEKALAMYQTMITTLNAQQQKFVTELLTQQRTNAELQTLFWDLQTRIHLMETTHGLLTLNKKI